ncbi:BMP family lipoprotein [Catonella massiliensis]|jgi:hypothetical protein|uniref:BMP family ABC transporter substrate-binding protein n=1 Tax=Catonella massiliensis TaxID=2799636 RepID=A0ABS1IZJ6_9FIRM|nr:BMP family ABC transporter substrate-binding protein [Catonella massiliensis]MBK5897306.1 BMP family ABC transporter substrate-binding protein [Catonella massiliensis]
MKKRLLSMALSAVMVLSLAACGGQAKDSASTKSASKTTSTTSTASTTSVASTTSAAGSASSAKSGSTTTAKSDLKVGLITDVGGIHDHSFNETSWKGLEKAKTDFGVEINYLESKTDADYSSNIESFVDEDYDLIVCVGFKLAEATKKAAESHPDKKFAIIDDASNASLPNVTCLTFKQEQASYLVGYVAGLVTKKNNVGFVLGMASEMMNKFGYGYLAGVYAANPKATVQQIDANNFADPAIGKTSATTMITNGADVIFHAAGGTGVGVIQACQENKISAIGVDTDQSSLAPDTVITSAMKRVDNAVYDSVKQLVEGTLKGGEVVYDLSKGGVDIAPTTKLLSEDVLKKVEEVKAKILSGEIVVPGTKAEFEKEYGDKYELD